MAAGLPQIAVLAGCVVQVLLRLHIPIFGGWDNTWRRHSRGQPSSPQYTAAYLQSILKLCSTLLSITTFFACLHLSTLRLQFCITQVCVFCVQTCQLKQTKAFMDRIGLSFHQKSSVQQTLIRFVDAGRVRQNCRGGCLT